MQELLDCNKQVGDLRAELETGPTNRDSFNSIHEFEEFKCEVLGFRPRVVAQRNADLQRLATLRFTATLFVDYAFELSGVITHTVIRFPDLPHRKSTVTRDRERFGQPGQKVIEEMRLFMLDLHETRGK
jgi:hypothetical protein